jgi:hypothetical protein
MPARSPSRRGGRSTTLVLAIASLVAACGSAGGDASVGPSATADASRPVVVTFEVAGGERFKALLTQADDIAIARQLLAGEDAPGIPNGRVVRETGVNVGYTWSMDPDDFEFAEVTTEVCDGIPSDVESGLVTSDRYCPWSAQVVAVDPAP